MPCPLIGWSFFEAVGDARADERKSPTSAKLCDFMVRLGRRRLVLLTRAGVAYFPKELLTLYLYTPEYVFNFHTPLLEKDRPILNKKVYHNISASCCDFSP